jgi:peptide/nickel transport system substrate-binding protein/oligopeptide transport system substrate-binding protein
LRPNLRFSDGTSLTSQDVAFSLDRALQPATASPSCLNALGLIKDADKLLAGRISTLIGDSILTPDVTTVIITLRQPGAYFIATLTTPCSSVVERSLVDKYGKRFSDHLQAGGGAGPFKLSRYTPGKEIDLVPNPNYYGPGLRLQEVTFTFYKDAETSYKAYLANQVDETLVPFSHLNQARNLPMDFHQILQPTISYYAMNYLVKPFDNIHMREAFALAIDKGVISSAIWHDTVRPTCHILPEGMPSGMPGYNPSLNCPANAPISGDPAQAKTLLQQALQEEGYTSVTQLPPITFTYAPSPVAFANEAMTVQQMWRQAFGIQVKLQPVSLSTLFSKIAAAAGNPHGLQLWASSWSAEYPDPHGWLTLQFDHGSSFNSVNYGQNNGSDAARQQANQLQMEDADVQFDSNLRTQMYNAVEQQLVNDVAWLPMNQANTDLLIKPYITYLYTTVSTTPSPDDWSHIYVVAH